MRRSITSLSNLLSYSLVILFVLPAIWPIVTPGHFPMHDDTQLARVAQMAQSLRDGQFPVRWVKDLGYGYGYPVFNFYNPLPYYFGAAFMLLGFDALIASKFMFVLPIIAAALGMYLLTRKPLGQLGALAASVFYTYTPYHAVQIYVRGSVAEYWAYAVIPFLLHFILAKKTLATGLTLAILILSHNLTTLMVLPLIGAIWIIQCLVSKNKLLAIRYSFTPYRLVLGLLALLIGLGLSAFFWLPATFEKNFTSVDAMVNEEFNPLEHFVYPRQLWYSPWGFGGSAPGEHDGLTFMLGQINILLSALAVILLVKAIATQRQKINNLLLYSLFSILYSLFMLLPFSRFLWSNIGFLRYLQFPWRYLSFAALGTAILSSFSIRSLLKYSSRLLAKTPNKLLLAIGYWLLAIFVLFSAKQYFVPQFKYSETVDQLLADEKIKWDYSRISDEYRPADALRPQYPETLPQNRYDLPVDEKETVTVVENKTHLLNLQTNLLNSKELLFNIYSFPGWSFYIDGEKTTFVEYGPQRLMSITAPEGSHTITASFKNTPIRKIANLITLITAISTLVIIAKKPKIIV